MFVCFSLEQGTSSLDFLRNLPQFRTFRRTVQQNPQALPVLLQQLGQANPELLQVKKGLVSKETVLLHWWGRETQIWIYQLS